MSLPASPSASPSRLRSARGATSTSLIVGALVILLTIGALVWWMRSSGADWVTPEELDASTNAAAGAAATAGSPATGAPAAAGTPGMASDATLQLPAGSPQPGPAPPGKVWSVEHGHWHDDPAAAGMMAPGQAQPLTMQPMEPGTLTPQPDGPVPPGKVWSPEHGHWHDDPAVAPTQPITLQPTFGPEGGAPPAPGTLTPQPDGPVPPGKVWSPEHGHWHDDPAAMP